MQAKQHVSAIIIISGQVCYKFNFQANQNKKIIFQKSLKKLGVTLCHKNDLIKAIISAIKSAIHKEICVYEQS